MAALQRIEETAALEQEPPAEEHDETGPPLAGAALEPRDVWFSYRPDRPVLQGLPMTVHPHAHVALVGPSDAGKSTVW
jgi:ABC-type multidrug transport system fused ATPase/permease subunit